MLTSTSRKNAANAAIDRAVRAALSKADERSTCARAAFEGLLWHVRRSSLLAPVPTGGRSGTQGCGEVVTGLLALAAYHQDWHRPVETWEPAGASPRSLFSSLARHLLAMYTVPAFMTPVWFEEPTAEALRRQGWFTHIGAGRNIRKADLPLSYTKMMAHHFLQAPDHLTVEAALRWGQVRGLGGSKPLALAIATTRLGHSFEAEDFWSTVVQFLVNHPDLDLAQVGRVVDYLHHERFVPQDVLLEEGELVPLDPPQPNLSMKGRTPRSLLRQVEEREKSLGLRSETSERRWPRCEIGVFRLAEDECDQTGGQRLWTIRELTSDEELRREGQAMRHCVASYAGDCARRETSIWSMRFENHERRFRVATIELDLATRTICQVRRQGNARPNEKVIGVMRQWAKQEGLQLGFWRNGTLVDR